MALVFVIFFAIIVLILGIWLLPFLLLTAVCVGAIAVSSAIFFRIFGPPDVPKPPSCAP
jgi:hypothetical protein